MKKLNLNIDKMVELYNDGKSCRYISKIMGLSGMNIVYNRLKPLGILRNPKEAAKLMDYHKILCKYPVNEHFFDTIDTEAKAYWLGFIYADGNVSIYKYKNKTGTWIGNVFSVKLSKRDELHLIKLRDLLSPTRKLTHYKNFCNLGISSKYLVNSLINVGVVPRKSHIIKFPNLSNDLIRHFIRGYFDGDGCISLIRDKRNSLKHKIKRRIIIVSCSYDFLLSVKNILNNNCNTNGGIYQTKHEDTYRLSYGGNNQIKKLYDYLYGDGFIYLYRRYYNFRWDLI